jgi:hypothetical membrane protein
VPWRNRVANIGHKRPGLGPVLYISCLQYFVVQLAVAEQWNPPYSWSRNTISDLGNTACGRFDGRPVCSPPHDLMNLSFIALGVAMLIGSVLIRQTNPDNHGTSIGFRCMEIAAAGVILVGLFPENRISALHGIGATLAFVVGNVSVILLGMFWRIPAHLRVFSICLGVLALAALVAYTSSHFAGLGEGGMERVVAYPQTVWLVVIGAYLMPSSRRRQALPT